jgi:hypothetical protein
MLRVRLTYAQLEQANLGSALLEGASFANAELRDTYLGGANLKGADFQAAVLEKVNFEEANLAEANFFEASVKNSNLEGANLSRANLQGATLKNTRMSRSILVGADLRFCDLTDADLVDAQLTGAKLYGIEVSLEQLGRIQADWIDFSVQGDGTSRLSMAQLQEVHQKGDARQSLAPPASAAPRRVFGKGDVLRNAGLEFGALSVIEIEGRFEACNIVLGSGAQLRIGRDGVLEGCTIAGDGELVVLGRFAQAGEKPGIVGLKQVLVGSSGTVISTIQQPPSLTRFGFDRGCQLQLKIRKST